MSGSEAKGDFVLIESPFKCACARTSTVQWTIFDILKFILGSEAWGIKQKKCSFIPLAAKYELLVYYLGMTRTVLLMLKSGQLTANQI